MNLRTPKLRWNRRSRRSAPTGESQPCRFRGRRVLRPYGLQTAVGSRPDHDQAPELGVSPTECLRRARRFALATRPATCRCGKTLIDPTQPTINTPPVLRFLHSKNLQTVPGAGTLPVGGTGGRSAPGRRRQGRPPVACSVTSSGRRLRRAWCSSPRQGCGQDRSKCGFRCGLLRR